MPVWLPGLERYSFRHCRLHTPKRVYSTFLTRSLFSMFVSSTVGPSPSISSRTLQQLLSPGHPWATMSTYTSALCNNASTTLLLLQGFRITPLNVRQHPMGKTYSHSNDKYLNVGIKTRAHNTNTDSRVVAVRTKGQEGCRIGLGEERRKRCDRQ